MLPVDEDTNAEIMKGNLDRILASIAIAKERGATLRVGPELEVP